jgi:hypothetical protein
VEAAKLPNVHDREGMLDEHVGCDLKGAGTSQAPTGARE